MKIIRTALFIFFVLIAALALTLITQVGGIIFLLSLFSYPIINKRFNRKWSKLSIKLFVFATIYLTCTLFIVPPIAKLFGRVPLPILDDQYVQPSIIFTALANRNYVKPELRTVVYNVAEQLNKKYPGSKVNYLDANFPFFDGFRLLPHLSHGDGKKLDLSFLYRDSKTNEITDEIPSSIGYGVCEEPKSSEENMPMYCARKGHSQYNILNELVSQKRKQDFRIDEQRTKAMIEAIAKEDKIVKIYIEPHLKKRWKLKTSKIRFHGCQAVRHDDHVHIQIQ